MSPVSWPQSGQTLSLVVQNSDSSAANVKTKSSRESLARRVQNHVFKLRAPPEKRSLYDHPNVKWIYVILCVRNFVIPNHQ